MERIKKFEDCKIENLKKIKGGSQLGSFLLGRSYTYTEDDGGDKIVLDRNGDFIKLVTNTSSWFNRD